ncbi:hypothetical protein WJX81_007965 [Elliptochloris bilobata]|uniref:ENTH domain-containing protein n=1 Tax=Elliptochloris bilobata TaxID=381761 RepID=A0AAW1RNG0_9CHLO
MQAISVAEYAAVFFQRVVNNEYSEDDAENARGAGKAFVELVNKLQRHPASGRDDIKVLLRVLRDEIGRAYFKSDAGRRGPAMEALFGLYDALEASAQEGLAVPPNGADAAAVAAAGVQLLEELRTRFARLAVGDTWDKTPEQAPLRLMALKRIFKYYEQEKARGRPTNGSPALASKSVTQKLSRAMSRSASTGAGASTAGLWEGVLSEVGKAGSGKLFPLLLQLLKENARLGGAAAAAGADPATPLPAQGLQAPEQSAASGSASASDLGRRTSDFNLDDLLGLGVPEPPSPAPSATPGTPATAGAAPSEDPFQVLMERGRSGTAAAPPPPAGGAPPTDFHPQFPAPPPPPPAAAAGNNPFGRPAAFPAPPAADAQPPPSLPQQQTNAADTGSGGFEGSAFSPPSQLQIDTQGFGGGPASVRAASAGPIAFSPEPASAPAGAGAEANTDFGAGAFNPFQLHLPSPLFASPVPLFADNRFADVSPVAAAPAPLVPQPMRAPPAPPGGLGGAPGSGSFSAW